ncbi:hypothetical protein D3C85_1662540 [compost metagenome]
MRTVELNYPAFDDDRIRASRENGVDVPANRKRQVVAGNLVLNPILYVSLDVVLEGHRTKARECARRDA